MLKSTLLNWVPQMEIKITKARVGKGKKGRKIGRNKKKCERYESMDTRAKNKEKRRKRIAMRIKKYQERKARKLERSKTE